MNLQLISKDEAARYIASIGQGERPLQLRLGEDHCFEDQWIDVGDIVLRPSRATPGGGEGIYDEDFAVRFGGFEWRIPTGDALKQTIAGALSMLDKALVESAQKHFMQGLQDVLRRTLLLLPVFDVGAMAHFPLRRPTTVVPDTNAVHQGALDFVARFLNPWARIKVPAIVHMEILTQVDNYFSRLRWHSENKQKKESKPASLHQHILSQGGQRTLLRIELHSDAELDRGDLGADPLRGIVGDSSDPEDKKLGLQRITRSFADRLIVETARRFQTQVRPDHPLYLLTSDQGMARMAMSEGIGVWFFQARAVPHYLGKVLTGTLFHPFSRELYTVPLTDVLWEMAITFGAIRIQSADSTGWLELWGIGAAEETMWQPQLAREDLLWARYELPPPPATADSEARVEGVVSEASTLGPSPATSERQKLASGYHIFSPPRMLQLIGIIAREEATSSEQARRAIGINSRDQYLQYERFLRSGGLLLASGEEIRPTGTLRRLWEALVNGDLSTSLECLLEVPSFERVYSYVHQIRLVPLTDSALPVSNKARPTYLNLGEAVGAWVVIPDRGIAVTNNSPEPFSFTGPALDTYETLKSQGETEWVLTGKWLEEVAVMHHIHPVHARTLLQQCMESELLRVFAEGSTPDTRFERHTLWVLQRASSGPTIDRVFLYHGDFLLPGTSSVRIKIEGVSSAP